MTVLSLTWESPYLERQSLYWDWAQLVETWNLILHPHRWDILTCMVNGARPLQTQWWQNLCSVYMHRRYLLKGTLKDTKRNNPKLIVFLSEIWTVSLCGQQSAKLAWCHWEVGCTELLRQIKTGALMWAPLQFDDQLIVLWEKRM